MSREEKVVWEKVGKVAVIKLNRPECLNAMDLDVWERIPEVAAEIEADSEVRCAILTGSGEKAFSAGLDLKGAAQLMGKESFEGSAASRAAFAQRYLGTLSDHFSSMENLRVPVVAAINGYCLGAGGELICTCDIRVAGDNAIFSIEEVALGVIPDMGSTQRLSRIVGVGKAKQILLTGMRIDAREGYRIGLFDELCDPAETFNKAMEIAEKIAGNAPLAVQATKRAINMSMNTPLAVGLKCETLLAASNIIAEDIPKGIMARVMKKEPEFEGK